MLSFTNFASLALLTKLAHGSLTQSASPTFPEANIHGALMARATTSYYTIVSTAIPHDQYSIGLGQNGTGGDYYWLSCVNNPLTIASGYAGCGFDDVYTRCSGKTAFGIDGDSIVCDLNCITHKIFENLEVTDFTPLVGCGRGTSSMALLRTATGSATTLPVPAFATTTTSFRSGEPATTSKQQTSSSAPTPTGSARTTRVISVRLMGVACFIALTITFWF